MANAWPRHTCALSDSAEQQAEVTAAFVRQGLALGERAVFLGLELETRELDRRLREEGCDTAAHIQTGALVFTPEQAAAQLFTSSDEQVARRLRDTVEQAVCDGYAGVFVTSGSQPTGAGTHEAVIAPLIRRHPATVLYLYDRAWMDDAAIAGVTALHEFDRARPAVFDDGWLRITPTGRTKCTWPASSTQQQPRRGDRRPAPGAGPRRRRGHHRPAGRPGVVRFCDVAGLRALRAAARAEPGIRLRRPHPMLCRIP